MSLRMPPAIGYVTITPMDALGNEVRASYAIGATPVIMYLRREKVESYDDFVRRVIKFCEAENAKVHR